MPPTTAANDAALRARLSQFEAGRADYWSFKGNAKRDHGHGLMQYPAMMVPQMVNAMLTAVCEVEPNVSKVLDPFVGSGTVLTEASLRGLDFVGTDINPLAALLCRVKAGPINAEAVRERSEECLARIRRSSSTTIDVDCKGRDKWFTTNAQIGLSQIRRAIQAEASLVARRFLWLTLAETVRLTSNSRTSTFKLHIRSTSERRGRRPDPTGVFARVLAANLKRYSSLADTLRERGHLSRGHYTGSIDVHVGDNRQSLAKHVEEGTCDVVFTSPPYGDNTTTVPYGQYSFLPLNWIDLEDIGPDVDPTCLRTTHEVDRRSLGGASPMPAEQLHRLIKRSPALRKTLELLRSQPADRTSRVSRFAFDLDSSLEPILASVRRDGLLFWVLGNRRVGGQVVPLDQILLELLCEQGCTEVAQIHRQIPSKRMALRNNVASTMTNETILIVRKGVR